MKTRTYARLSLLIPLVIWVIFFLVTMVINVYIPADKRPDGPSSLFGVLEIILFYYVIGILIWLIPYLVLSIALLILSFKSRLEVLRYIFVLSPFAMTILVMLEATLISLATTGNTVTSIDYMSTFKSTTEVNIFVGLLALIWGYVCVGIGYGVYKLLHRSGRIIDEEKINPVTINVTSQELA
jgi:hypothetical protein